MQVTPSYSSQNLWHSTISFWVTVFSGLTPFSILESPLIRSSHGLVNTSMQQPEQIMFLVCWGEHERSSTVWQSQSIIDACLPSPWKLHVTTMVQRGCSVGCPLDGRRYLGQSPLLMVQALPTMPFKTEPSIPLTMAPFSSQFTSLQDSSLLELYRTFIFCLL